MTKHGITERRRRKRGQTLRAVTGKLRAGLSVRKQICEKRDWLFWGTEKGIKLKARRTYEKDGCGIASRIRRKDQAEGNFKMICSALNAIHGEGPKRKIPNWRPPNSEEGNTRV